MAMESKRTHPRLGMNGPISYREARDECAASDNRAPETYVKLVSRLIAPDAPVADRCPSRTASQTAAAGMPCRIARTS
jgi:hypothetical protein